MKNVVSENKFCLYDSKILLSRFGKSIYWPEDGPPRTPNKSKSSNDSKAVIASHSNGWAI